MRGELDKRLVERVRGMLTLALDDGQFYGALLLVGARSSTLGAVTTIARAEDATPAEHDAMLWVAPAEALALHLGFSHLRRSLKAGARVVLAVRKRPPVLHQVRGLLGGPAPRPILLEVVCGALLTAGLVLPRVHEGPRGWHLLSAALPNDPCLLDAFFAQPLPA